MSEKSPGHRPKKRRRKQPTDPSKTGRALRQQFTTPSVADMIDALPGAASPPTNGPTAVGHQHPHPIYDDIDTVFRDRDVQSVYDAIRHSNVVPYVEERIAALQLRKGRPLDRLSYEALLVGIMLTVLDGKGVVCSHVAKTLWCRLDPPSMRLLGLKPIPEATTATQARRQRWMIEKRVRDALRRFLAPMDPSIHPKGMNLPWEELRRQDRFLSPEEVEERMSDLTLVCNSILRIPYDMLPEKVKRKYRGSAAIDATHIRVHARGRSVDSPRASTDPDAAFYARIGDHSEDGESQIVRCSYGYDVNLMTLVCDWLGERQYLPTLPGAMALGRPGVDPAGAARRMIAALAQAGHEPRYLAGDGLYALADPDAFQTPARKAGWRLVLPILDNHVGVQASMEGLLLVEGHWYCPSIPQHLIDATRDFRAKEIELAEYRQRIAERATYRVRFKGWNRPREDNDGNEHIGTQRWGCPASGAHPGVMCELKERSEKQQFIGPAVLGVRKLKDRIVPDPSTQVNGVWPKPCRQQSVTLNLSHESDQSAKQAARYIQDLVFGTHEHTDTYNALRQSQEGLHGFAKDDAYEALGTPGKRRLRGLAAQSLCVAFMLAVAGIRKVRIFLRHAVEDANGDLYVPRKRRKGEHATSHLPPGTKGTRGDPEFDDLVE